MKKLISFLVLAAAFYLFQPKIATPFSLEFIALDFETNSTPFECPELSKIVREPLHYIGHGGQAIAFGAPNSPYVIKFFLSKRISDRKCIELPSLRQLIPAYRKMKTDRLAQQRQKTLQTLTERYERAFADLKEETGLVALHCSASKGNLPFCTLKDKRGRLYRVDLNRASFVIQKRATPLSHLNKFQKAKASSAIEHLLEVRAMRGYTDLRQAFNQNNFGLLDGKAIMIDPGTLLFYEEQKNSPENEIQRMKGLLKRWLDGG